MAKKTKTPAAKTTATKSPSASTSASKEVSIRNIDPVPTTPLPDVPTTFEARTGKLPAGFRSITDAQRKIAHDVLAEIGAATFAADWGADAPAQDKVVARAEASIGWDDYRGQAVALEGYANTMSLASWNSFLNLVAPMRDMLKTTRTRKRLVKSYAKTIAFLTAREVPAARAVATKKKEKKEKEKAAGTAAGTTGK